MQGSGYHLWNGQAGRWRYMGSGRCGALLPSVCFCCKAVLLNSDFSLSLCLAPPFFYLCLAPITPLHLSELEGEAGADSEEGKKGFSFPGSLPCGCPSLRQSTKDAMAGPWGAQCLGSPQRWRGSGVAHGLGTERLALPKCRLQLLGGFTFFFNETLGPRGQDRELFVPDPSQGGDVSSRHVCCASCGSVSISPWEFLKVQITPTCMLCNAGESVCFGENNTNIPVPGLTFQ